jgi:hypothetical protein
MPQENIQEVRLSRVIDFKIPLPYLIGGIVFVSWAVISMYFAVQTLITSVADLQITVKSGNVSSTVLAGEVALLKFRIANIEAEQQRINEVQQRRNGGGK